MNRVKAEQDDQDDLRMRANVSEGLTLRHEGTRNRVKTEQDDQDEDRMIRIGSLPKTFSSCPSRIIYNESTSVGFVLYVPAQRLDIRADAV